jgi:16S rRNA (cytosine967-C5)-methyltransferase
MPEPAAPDARGLALGVLLRVERDRAWADDTLDAALAPSRLDARDRAFATRLVYGTLAWQGLLDWHLQTLTGRPAAALDLEARAVLRLGLHQILLLDRVPPHAAVSTSVDLAKQHAPKAAGLVNAVLRRAVRERGKLPLPDRDAEPLRHLAVAYSHPEWLVRRWRDDFPGDELRDLLAANNEAAPTVLRARRGLRDELIERLARAGIAAEPGRFAPDAVRVATVSPRALAEHAPGAYRVQSEASQLVALLVAPEPGMRVLDACAAPGGKTTYLADLMDDRGLVVALERHPRRAATVRRAAGALGLTAVSPMTGDARAASQVLTGTFDRVLVDAPCTGLGTLRAHPEVRWTRDPADPSRLATLQREILEGITPLLRPGGALVYATCTLTHDENEDLIRAFLSAHPNLERVDAKDFLPATAQQLVDSTGTLRTLPHRDNLDGFYAIRLVRRA